MSLGRARLVLHANITQVWSSPKAQYRKPNPRQCNPKTASQYVMMPARWHDVINCTGLAVRNVDVRCSMWLSSAGKTELQR
eukprot:357386-Chlamydomonas_euryale.AAC.3